MDRRGDRRRVALGGAGAAAVLVALGLSALGEPSPRDVATDHARAWFVGDLVDACALWSQDYRAEVLPAYAADVDDPPDDCAELGEQQAGAAGDWPAEDWPAEDWPDEGFAMTVDAARVTGGTAVVSLRASGGDQRARWQQAMEVELVTEDGAWRVDGFRSPRAGRTGG